MLIKGTIIITIRIRKNIRIIKTIQKICEFLIFEEFQVPQAYNSMLVTCISSLHIPRPHHDSSHMIFIIIVT